MNKTSLMTRVLIGCAALAFATSVCAQDWPQWRGPNRDNKVTGFTPPATWPATPKAGWKVTVGKSDGSPALVGDKLYTFTRVGNDEVIACLNANDGKKVWEDKYASAAITGGDASAHPGPRATPAVGEGKVCTFGVNGQLTCVDAASGKRLWQKDTKSNSGFHTAASPLVIEGKCVASLGTKQGEVIAYDLTNGAEKWKYPGAAGKAAFGSPVLMTVDGTKQVVAVNSSGLVGLSLADGKEVWKFSITGMNMNDTPAIDGDMVYFSVPGMGAGTVAVKVDKSGAKQVWKVSQAFHQYNSPTLKDGLLYGISSGSTLLCMDAKDGSKVYDGPRCGAPGAVLDCGKVMALLSQNGNLVFFEPGRTYKELKSYKVSDAPWGEPILSKNRIFVKGTNELQLWTIE